MVTPNAIGDAYETVVSTTTTPQCRYREFLVGSSLHAETPEVPVSCWCRSVEILARVAVTTHGRKSRQIARADSRDRQPIRISRTLSVTYGLAERVGFEPTVEFPLHTLSKRAPSTTRTSLRLSGINSLPEGGEPCKSKL